MQQNTSNFSNVLATDNTIDDSYIANVKAKDFTSCSGCNEHIKNIEDNNLLVIIPNIYIDDVVKKTNKSLEEILAECSSMGFKYEVFKPTSYTEVKFLANNVNLRDCTLINLPISRSYTKRTRYYAFCMIRHFYYYQDYLVSYLNIITSDMSEAYKLKLLSYLSSTTGGGNAFIYSGIFKEATFNQVLELYNDQKNNSNTTLNLTNINNCLMLFKTNDLVGFKSSLEAHEKLNDILENCLYSSTKIKELEKYEVTNAISDMKVKLFFNNNAACYAYNIKDLNLPYVVGTNNNVSVILYANNHTQNVKKSNNSHSHTLIAVNSEKYKKYIQEMVLNKRKDVTVAIRSRHPSHKVFRNTLTSKFKTLIRLGSTTVSKVSYDIELNSIKAISNSSNKLLMKSSFTDAWVKTPIWYTIANNVAHVNGKKESIYLEALPFPIVAKHIHGSRGTGNYKLNNVEELNAFLNRRQADLNLFIFENFMNYAKEYRIHVSTEGVFLMWRKLRKIDTPDNQRWFFNNENCNWVGINNELFDMPLSIKSIQEECMKALKSVSLDFGACDVRVMSSTNKDGNARKDVDFSIIEINSAPSMAEQTSEAYITEFIKLIEKRSETLI